MARCRRCTSNREPRVLVYCEGRHGGGAVPASALIHDDIIDRSDTRRGAPSVHKRFEAAHEQNSWRGDAFNYGLTGGILAGDLTLAWSAEVFASLGEGAIYGAPARTIFDRMRTEVLAGQYLDVYSEVLETEDAQAALQRALNVIRFKSAKYSCEHPFTIGGALALQAAALEGGTGRRERAAPGTCRLPCVRPAAG